MLPAGLVLAYNLEVAGNLAGGYGLRGSASLLQHHLLAGIAGLLLSPTRGLFIFSPFLLFLAFGWKQVSGDRGSRRLTTTLAVAAVLQVLLYAQFDWRAGASWGPRWLTDLLPLLLWMLAPVVAELRGTGRLAFVLASGAAIAIQAVGAFWYTGASDVAIFAATPGTPPMRAAWKLRNAPFLAELRHAPAPGDLALDVAGNIDQPAAMDSEAHTVTAGEAIAVAGWALTGGRSPWQVMVMLDGKPAESTSRFFARPDVIGALHETSPAGWRISIRTGGLAPGEHLLAAFARAEQIGELHFLAQRRLTVLAAQSAGRGAARQSAVPGGAGPFAGDDLAAEVQRAAAALGEHQQAAGYWLTSHTRAARFADPRREMNTFLTAMIVDLLEPVAAETGLGESLERARRNLAGQIEAGGLIRYHGRPDALIPGLGCIITPDADDTALVWRLAPGGQPALLPAALAALDRYRTGEGLYRTWLAPRDRYQCIDPGEDPNPADVGIQMHVLLLLAQADPPAARALCSALRRARDDDRIWVYYRQAPLVPILRQADLRRAGCALPLPAARLRTSVPGQQIWVDACRLLQRFAGTDGPAPGPDETRSLLRALAGDGFAAIRRSPPLLYHNDLTASTARFYWSEDFGYALWLRLYLANAHRR
ncbi:MAG: hypothetical protein JOZ15_21040 [Acidobacteria bacterium]|nr:hypothetical protein [Acidobacteriota bacterium]